MSIAEEAARVDDDLARTARARAACRQATESIPARLLSAPVIAAFLWPHVRASLLAAWIGLVFADAYRTSRSVRVALRELDESGADAGWERRKASRWWFTAAVIGLLPVLALTSGSAQAMFIAVSINLASSAMAVVVAQGFSRFAIVSTMPMFVASFGSLLAGPPSLRRIAVLTCFYALTLARLHKEFGRNTVELALATARNERLNGQLVVEQDRLVASQRALESANAQLSHDATHDALTGLANRALLTEALDAALAQRGDQVLTVLYADLDRFKEVNDGRGHAAGDELLQQVATRLKTLVRGGDTVARVGGDEFVLVLPNCSSIDIATAVARRVERELSRPFELADGPAEIGVTIGISLARPGMSAERLLASADATMYEGKRTGRGRIVLAGT